MRPAIQRQAIDGVIRHPWTGQVEFTTTDQCLAEKVAATLDEHSPIEGDWLIATLCAMHPKDRMNAEWVMPTATMLAVRRLTDFAGQPLAMPPLSPDAQVYVLGVPVVIDEDAVGVSLRVREAVAR